MKKRNVIIFSFLALSLLLPSISLADRIKDLASIQGVRNNQLIGYGLVVGLDGSGDMTTQTPFTVQSVINMLGQLGVNLPPGTNLVKVLLLRPAILWILRLTDKDFSA